MEQEIIAERKLKWLEERGLKLEDVLCDEDGVEFVMVEPQLMDEDEVESAKFTKIELPDFSLE